MRLPSDQDDTFSHRGGDGHEYQDAAATAAGVVPGGAGPSQSAPGTVPSSSLSSSSSTATSFTTSTSFVPSSAVSLTNGNPTNGHTPLAAAAATSNGVNGSSAVAHGKRPAVRPVDLPGRKLYDDSTIDREEYVRLVIQSLRDVGYIESAATLEAESGYKLEETEVSDFRRCVLEGVWGSAEALLHNFIVDKDSLLDAKFLVNQQKYLELLEAQKMTEALYVLRNELAPLDVGAEQLHVLSSLIMCVNATELRQRAGWDGTSGKSRRQLLDDLQRYIPSSIMIPPRRMSHLLEQAQDYQRQYCVYHNTVLDNSSSSLYSDHSCDKDNFPRVTTTILQAHSDEVWNIEWSHNGSYLASASKDKSAIIWRIGSEPESSSRDYASQTILGDHPDPVGCLCWSLDDTVLLTSCENLIRMWDVKSGTILHDLKQHREMVTSMTWLPDNSGFISGGMDMSIILWDAHGNFKDSWNAPSVRVTDMAVTPDQARLLVIGIHGHILHTGPDANLEKSALLIFDLPTKQLQTTIRLDGEVTSVNVSPDSQYALINHSLNEIHLLDINNGQMVRKYTGHMQGHHVIRSCFGGARGNFVVSGSEDAKVYIWHRDSGTLLEILEGHGEGSVNSVAWNPRNYGMFASCSDDSSIRLWEAPARQRAAAAAAASSSAGKGGIASSSVAHNGFGSQSGATVSKSTQAGLAESVLSSRRAPSTSGLSRHIPTPF